MKMKIFVDRCVTMVWSGEMWMLLSKYFVKCLIFRLIHKCLGIGHMFAKSYYKRLRSRLLNWKYGAFERTIWFKVTFDGRLLVDAGPARATDAPNNIWIYPWTVNKIIIQNQREELSGQ